MIEREVISTETKPPKKINNKQFEKKIRKLEQKLSDIDAKIGELQEAKRRLKAEISQCKDEQILSLVRSSNLTFEQISESIRNAQSLQDNEYNEDYIGFSKSDIETIHQSEITPQDYIGGIQNAQN